MKYQTLFPLGFSLVEINLLPPLLYEARRPFSIGERLFLCLRYCCFPGDPLFLPHRLQNRRGVGKSLNFFELNVSFFSFLLRCCHPPPSMGWSDQGLLIGRAPWVCTSQLPPPLSFPLPHSDSELGFTGRSPPFFFFLPPCYPLEHGFLPPFSPPIVALFGITTGELSPKPCFFAWKLFAPSVSSMVLP